MATSTASRTRKAPGQRKSAPTALRTARSPQAPSKTRRAARAPSLGHAGRAIRQGAGHTLKQLQAIEVEIAQLARRTVSVALAAAGGTTRQLAAVVRDVIAGAVQAAESAGSELTLSIKGAARGTIAGVHDARGNVERAASEIVKTSIKQGDRMGAEIGAVARSALDGIAQGVAEVGQSAAAIAKVSAREAIATARDMGTLATLAVQQVVRGTAAGIDEVVKAHRAAKPGAAGPTARKNGARAASRTVAR